jgi:lipid II:glycine glycyltransferase (peptidoglycan interpeptide bridge formation enzyme)
VIDEARVDAEPTDDWDGLAVERPGGHVYQSRAWAEHRRRSGWRARYVSVGDLRILALIRSWPLIGGGSAYLPKGPAPVVAGEVLGAALWATTKALAAERIDVIASDAEVPAADAAYARLLRRARFAPIEEIHPARHRMSLPLGPEADAESVFKGIAKTTRQRIRQAEKDGTVVARHDARAGAPDGVGEGFAPPGEPAAAALDRFYDLLLATGERLDFTFGPRAEYVAWWLAALDAGHLIYLQASSADGAELAGLVLYRHGGRLTTVHSGDRAEARKAHPGALHLLRWRAIQLAIREGCREMDLGGVDVPGARTEPRLGDPMYGLYQHKQSFGARWLELTGAQERVIRPRRYLAGRLVSRAARLVRR